MFKNVQQSLQHQGHKTRYRNWRSGTANNRQERSMCQVTSNCAFYNQTNCSCTPRQHQTVMKHHQETASGHQQGLSVLSQSHPGIVSRRMIRRVYTLRAPYLLVTLFVTCSCCSHQSELLLPQSVSWQTALLLNLLHMKQVEMPARNTQVVHRYEQGGMMGCELASALLRS